MLSYIRNIAAPAMAMAVCLGCGNQGTTQELLEANFLTQNLTTIDLTSPTNNQQVTSANPTLTWSSRGVSQYTVQMATDNAFTSLVLDKTVTATTYTVQNSDLVGVTSLTTSTYYWRVKIPQLQNNLQSKTQSFFLVAIPASGTGYAGILYVNGASTGTTQIGSKEAPYKKIQAAISAGDALRGGLTAVSLDIHVAQATYTEEVNLAAGISIRGGYEATDWTRNIAANTTTIIAQTDTAIRSGATINSAALGATTIVEGFTIKTVGVTTGFGYAIFCNKSMPTILSNTIQGGDGNFAYGIFNNESSPTVSGNTIVGGIKTLATATNYVGIYNQNGSSPTVRNNVILGGNANDSPGIYVNHINSSPIIENNTIGGTMVGANTGVLRIIGSGAITGSATPAVRNNIIFAYGAGAPVCVEENYNGADPTIFQNNNLFGCTAMYRDEGATSLNSICTDGKPGTGVCGSGTNVASGAATNSEGNMSINNAAPLFVNQNGPDANILTMADNDWRLNTNGLNCNVRGGGLDLSGTFTQDRDLITRTIGNPSGPCAATNTGATGWSIGAYESD
jgi:hypothetical protein